jgi:hypothetical protein
MRCNSLSAQFTASPALPKRRVGPSPRTPAGLLKPDGAVEDLTPLNCADEEAGHQLLDMYPYRCRSAGESEVAAEQVPADVRVFVWRNADAADPRQPRPRRRLGCKPAGGRRTPARCGCRRRQTASLPSSPRSAATSVKQNSRPRSVRYAVCKCKSTGKAAAPTNPTGQYTRTAVTSLQTVPRSKQTQRNRRRSGRRAAPPG